MPGRAKACRVSPNSTSLDINNLYNMSSRDYHRIDEVYHNMYKNRFHREEPFNEEAEGHDYHGSAKKHLSKAAKAIYHKLELEHPNDFNPEKAMAAVKKAVGSASEEDCESWMMSQDYSHTPDQKEGMKEYLSSEEGEDAEEEHCKWAAEGCKCGKCEECQ
jgi:hypothetical protein